MKNLFFKAVFSILAISMLLVGCGGGAPTNTPASTLNFSGVVAVGDPLPGAIVSGTCADGGGGSSAPAGLDGSYSLTIRGALPCSFIANDVATQLKMRSLAVNSGTVNITPLTEAIYQMSGGAVASLDSAKTNMKNLLVNMGITFSGDPITTPFVADGKGLDGGIKAFVSNAAKSTASGSIQSVLDSMQRQCNISLTGVGSTTEKPTPCTPAESVIPTLFSLDEADLLELSYSVIRKLDEEKLFGVGGIVFNHKFDDATQAAIERGTKYGVAYLIKNSSSIIRKFLCTNCANNVAKDIAEKIINGAKTANNKPTIEYGKGLVEIFLSGILDYFEEKYAKYVTDMCSNDNAGFGECMIHSTFYGVSAYSANVALQTAIDIAFNPAIASNPIELQLTVLANEINETASWLVKDGILLIDIFKQTSINNQSEYRANFAKALQRQYNSYPAMQTDELLWASNGMTAAPPSADYRAKWGLDVANLIKTKSATVGGESSASEPAPVVTRFGNTAQDIANGTLPDDASTINFMIDFQKKNVLRLIDKWSIIEAKCQALKAASGQVGISQCMNLMGISPAALLSCPVNKLLNNGLCIDLPPTVTSISPSNVKIGVNQKFTIIGTNLPTENAFYLDFKFPNCTNVSLVTQTANLYEYTCTPSTLGTFNADVVIASSGVMLKSQPVTVSAVTIGQQADTWMGWDGKKYTSAEVLQKTGYLTKVNSNWGALRYRLNSPINGDIFKVSFRAKNDPALGGTGYRDMGFTVGNEFSTGLLNTDGSEKRTREVTFLTRNGYSNDFFIVNSSTANSGYLYQNGVVDNSIWHLYTLKVEANTISLYYDGALKYSQSFTGAIGALDTFTIGGLLNLEIDTSSLVFSTPN
jgi:hypothetical protein